MPEEDSSRYMVREEDFDGLAAVVLRDRAEDLAATILPGVGSNLTCFAKPSLGVEYLLSPRSPVELRANPTRFGNPVLMTPNRIWEGSFTFAGRTYRFASDRSFPHWVVWTGPAPGAPFICLEPYFCVTNAPNLPLPASATGLVALAEGEGWRGWIEMRPLGPAG